MPLRAAFVIFLVLILPLPADAASASASPETPDKAAWEIRDGNETESGARPPGIVYPDIVEEGERADERQERARAAERERENAERASLQAATGVMHRVAAFALYSFLLLVGAALLGIGVAGLVTLMRARRSK